MQSPWRPAQDIPVDYPLMGIIFSFILKVLIAVEVSHLIDSFSLWNRKLVEDASSQITKDYLTLQSCDPMHSQPVLWHLPDCPVLLEEKSFKPIEAM